MTDQVTTEKELTPEDLAWIEADAKQLNVFALLIVSMMEAAQAYLTYLEAGPQAPPTPAGVEDPELVKLDGLQKQMAVRMHSVALQAIHMRDLQAAYAAKLAPVPTGIGVVGIGPDSGTSL